MSGAAALPEVSPEAPPDAGRASPRDWLAVGAGTLGALMALVDVSIVNASLPVIQGEIGATPSEGTWVGTSYLIAEIVVIPLTAWLERMFGMRRLLVSAALLFTAFSVVCGSAATLDTMIMGRVGQGLAGGVLIPTAMTIVAQRLPPGQQPIGLALIAITALIGPATGPLLGGWLTDTFSWSLIFLLNIPVCALQVVMLFIALPGGSGDLHELRRADWPGIAGMIVGLGAITTLLEEGHREQWFESPLIWKLAIAAACGFALVLAGQLRRGRPVIRLALLRNPVLASVVAIMAVLGVLMFTGIFVTPQFLAAIAGYTALQAGLVVFLGAVMAIPTALTYPLASRLLDPRVLVGMGVLMMAGGNLLAASLTTLSSGTALVPTQVLLGMGSTLMAMPLQQIGINSVPVEDVAEANSLMAVARNLGGSIGLAAIASFQEQRFDYHHWQLNGAIMDADGAAQQRLAETAAMLGGGPDGTSAAIRALDGEVMMQSLVMTFNDLFLVLGVAGLVMVPLVVFLRRPEGGMTLAMVH